LIAIENASGRYTYSGFMPFFVVVVVYPIVNVVIVVIVVDVDRKS
jgi:hypothetical protein